ncbi:hypothetical protein GCM10009557_75320 [Virgisporangium ochraceum]|uniref:Uncharacterized protein n=1 Tax=Virgisporangium ochraceum TaxID=65505 RepID=A0A8J4EBC3_9ACTN|nr:hypothetical protein Voc01_033560 [Virgisporangium ochraceum]
MMRFEGDLVRSIRMFVGAVLSTAVGLAVTVGPAAAAAAGEAPAGDNIIIIITPIT